MNDIEKLKKIAKLSEELKKHGFAKDTMDAINQSEGVYESEIARQAMTQQREETKMNPQVADEFDRFKNHAHQRMQKLEGQMNVVINKINEIVGELKKREAEPRPAPQAAPQEEKQEQKQEQLQTQPKEQKKTESHQRVGEFKPGDIEIDKVFYYGRK